MGFEFQEVSHIVYLMDPLHCNFQETLGQGEEVELLLLKCPARLILVVLSKYAAY